MGYRTGAEPDKAQTFLERICNALDYTPHDLAKIVGVKHSELAPLLKPLATVADINKDEVWWLISALVNDRIASHLAIKSELNKALTAQRSQQAAQLAALRARLPAKVPPRRPPLRR